MPSTHTSRFGLEKMATGEFVDTWGARLNQYVFDQIDGCLAGRQTVTHDDSTDYVLFSTIGGIGATHTPVLRVVGTLTANRRLSVNNPSPHERPFLVENATTGGFALLLRPDGGATELTIPFGRTVLVYYDGNVGFYKLLLDTGQLYLANVQPNPPAGGASSVGQLFVDTSVSPPGFYIATTTGTGVNDWALLNPPRHATGTGAPTSDPTYIGTHYVDTSVSPPKVYYGYRTGFGADNWILLNDGGGGATGYGASYGTSYGV